MIRAIVSWTAVGAMMLLAGVASAQAPSAPPLPQGAAASQAPAEASPPPEPEVVWLRRRVEQLEAQLAYLASCGIRAPAKPAQPKRTPQRPPAGQQAPTSPPPPTPPSGHM